MNVVFARDQHRFAIAGIAVSRRTNNDLGSNKIKHTVNALASRGDEGRAKLRKAWGSCIEAVISGCPNGETRLVARPVTRKGANPGN